MRGDAPKRSCGTALGRGDDVRVEEDVLAW